MASWTRLRSAVVEGLVLAPVVAFAAQDVFLPRHPRGLLALADAALVLPLLLRRRYPRGVFWVVLGLAVALTPWDYRLTGSVALVLALYTLASHRPERDVLPAVVALEVALLGVSVVATRNWFTSFLSFTAVTAAVAGVGLWARARRELVARLRDDATRLRRERDQQAELAAATERARIARELHDVVAHHLTVVVALADGAARAWQRGPGANAGTGADALEAVRTIAATGRRALTDTRALLGVLGGDGPAPTAPQPGLGDLDALVASTRRAGLDVTLARAAPSGHLPAAVQLAAYRAVQEGLTNALRHAGPGARVDVGVTVGDGLVVDVADDGGRRHRPGPSGPAAATGRGLPGLRERVHALGGHVEAGPAPAGGWRLRAEIPLGAA